MTNPIADTVAWSVPPFAVVLHRGRASGGRYRTPVWAFPVQDGFVIALTYGPGADWVRNIVAAGRCTLVRSRAVFNLTDPRVLVEDDAVDQVPAYVRPPLRLFRIREFLRMSIDQSSGSPRTSSTERVNPSGESTDSPRRKMRAAPKRRSANR